MKYVIDSKRENDWKMILGDDVEALDVESVAPDFTSKDVIFAHVTDYHPSSNSDSLVHQALVTRDDPQKSPVVVFYTGYPVTAETKQQFRSLMSPVPPEKVLLLRIDTSYKVEDVLRKYSAEIKGERPIPEAALALRLLCEAWVPDDGSFNRQETKGISVYPPDTLHKWIAPFDINPISAADAAITVSIQIGRPSLEAAVKAVFEKFVLPVDDASIEAAKPLIDQLKKALTGTVAAS